MQAPAGRSAFSFEKGALVRTCKDTDTTLANLFCRVAKTGENRRLLLRSKIAKTAKRRIKPGAVPGEPSEKYLQSRVSFR